MLANTVRELELQSDRTIANIYIGKTYILRRKKPGGGYLKFDPLNSNTWKKKGISSRWQDHKKHNYGRDGLVVLGAITRETMPERSSQVNQEHFALAMEQKLLHHYLLSHPDPKVPVVNETFSTGATTKQVSYAYAVYMAFRYEDETFSEEEPMDTSPSFPIQANEHDQSTSSAQRPTLFLSDTSYMQPSLTATDDVVLLPSNFPAHQFSSPSPTRRPQVTFSSLPLPGAGHNNQLASKRTIVKSNTSCPSTPRGRGILKKIPKKQPQRQPFTSARNLIPAFNSERLSHDDQHAGRANLPHTVNTSTAYGSSYTSCQRYTATPPSAPYLNSQTSPITSPSCGTSNPHSSTIKSVSITLTTGGSQSIGIEVNLQPTLKQATVSSSQNIPQTLDTFPDISNQNSSVTTSRFMMLEQSHTHSTPISYSRKRCLEQTQIKSTRHQASPTNPSDRLTTSLPGYLPLPKTKNLTPNAGKSPRPSKRPNLSTSATYSEYHSLTTSRSRHFPIINSTSAAEPSDIICLSPSSSGKAKAQDICEVVTISDSDSDSDCEIVIGPEKFKQSFPNH